MNSSTALAALNHAFTVNVPVILWGPPGIGKTDRIRQLAGDLGWPLVTVLASIRQPDDFAGLPWIHEGGVTMVPPDWGRTLSRVEGPAILFFDEVNCFVEGTPVRVLKDGRPVDVPIETIRPGWSVLGHDLNSGRSCCNTVTYVTSKRSKHIVRITFACGRSIVCTGNHRLLTPKGWCAARDLRAGLCVRDLSAVQNTVQAGDRYVQAVVASRASIVPQWATVQSVEACAPSNEKDTVVYDLTVDPVHNFTVHGLVAHNCTAAATQAALLRVVLERVVGDLELPSTVRVVAAANPPDQAAGGWDLARPLANRFTHVEWPAPQAHEWVGWLAHQQDIHPTARGIVGAFITRRPELLLQVPNNETDGGRAWASPRSWAMAAKLMGDRLPSPAIEMSLIGGCVGDAAGLELATWLESTGQLPDPEELLADPASWEPPHERLDLLYATLHGVTTATIARMEPGRWKAAWELLGKARGIAADAVIAAGYPLAVERARHVRSGGLTTDDYPAPLWLGEAASTIKELNGVFSQ